MQHERLRPARRGSGPAHALWRFPHDRLRQATWTTISTLPLCAAIWKARSRRWCASIRTASPETFSVPPLAIAANWSRARWPPSPRKTAAFFSTCHHTGRGFSVETAEEPGALPQIHFTSAASSIASLRASAWSSTKRHRRANPDRPRPQGHSRPHQSPEKSRRPRRLRHPQSPTRSPCASTNPSRRTKPYDPAHKIHFHLSFRAKRGICFFLRRLKWWLVGIPSGLRRRWLCRSFDR